MITTTTKLEEIDITEFVEDCKKNSCNPFDMLEGEKIAWHSLLDYYSKTISDNLTTPKQRDIDFALDTLSRIRLSEISLQRIYVK